MLLTGDHVMHGSTVVIRPPDGDLGQYLASLAKVRDLTPAVQTLAPGHGRLMTPVVPVIDALIAHRRGRHDGLDRRLPHVEHGRPAVPGQHRHGDAPDGDDLRVLRGGIGHRHDDR